LHDDFTSPDDLGIKVSKQKQDTPPAVAKAEPEPEPAPVTPSKPPVKQAANPRPAAADTQAGRDSLLPRQMLYKAAPMQDMPEQNGAQSPYVMPKDYALYGRDAMRINTPVEEPAAEKEEPKQRGKAKKHNGVIAVSAVLLVLTVILSAFTGLIKYYSDNTARLLGGKNVCVVEKSTKSPYLSRGDIVFVTPVKPEKLEENSIAAVLVKEKGFFVYGIITDLEIDENGKTTATVKSVNGKSEIMENEVRAELILGTADNYIPKAGYLVNLLNSYTVVCACAAGVLILLLIIILIAASKSGKKAAADDKSGSI
jgi:hypothetical protein